MPKVNIEYTSPLKAAETFAKVKDLLANDESIRKIDSNIKCDFNDAKMCGNVTGSKFKAQMSVKEAGDQSNVSIVVDLPILLSAFKGQVKATIEKKLTKILA